LAARDFFEQQFSFRMVPFDAASNSGSNSNACKVKLSISSNEDSEYVVGHAENAVFCVVGFFLSDNPR
jgi:hypothetical protein